MPTDPTSPIHTSPTGDPAGPWVSPPAPRDPEPPPRSGGWVGILVIAFGLIVTAIGSQDCGPGDAAPCVTRVAAVPVVFGLGIVAVIIGIALLTGFRPGRRS